MPKALSTLAKLLTQDKATVRDMTRIFLFTCSRPSATAWSLLKLRLAFVALTASGL